MSYFSGFGNERHWIWIGLALGAYLLPWAFNPGAGLTMGAYDYAELISKRGFDDAGYMTTLLLRGQLVLVTLYVASHLRSRLYRFTLGWWSMLVLGLLLVVAQLPPLTFVNNTNDVNQQQQAILACVSLLLLLVGMSGIFWRGRVWIRLLVGVAGIASTVWALYSAYTLMQPFNLPMQIGVGAVAMIVLYAGMVSWQGWQLRHSGTEQSHT